MRAHATGPCNIFSELDVLIQHPQYPETLGLTSCFVTVLYQGAVRIDSSQLLVSSGGD